MRIMEFRSLEPKRFEESSGPWLGFTYIFLMLAFKEKLRLKEIARVTKVTQLRVPEPQGPE